MFMPPDEQAQFENILANAIEDLINTRPRHPAKYLAKCMLRNLPADEIVEEESGSEEESSMEVKKSDRGLLQEISDREEENSLELEQSNTQEDEKSKTVEQDDQSGRESNLSYAKEYVGEVVKRVSTMLETDQSKASLSTVNQYFKSENITMWFKYQFKEGVTKEKKDEIYTFWDRFDTYFTTIYEQGKTVLMDMSYAKTDNGWEAWQIFVDAEAYETHSETAAKCQLMEQVAELQENWEEVDAWISGPEEELAKAKSLDKDYPNQKRIFKNSDVRHDPLWFGFKNMKDGDETDKTGGPMVFEFEFAYNNPEDKDECVSIINKLQQEMKKNDVMGPIMTMLKFWHVNEGKGYKCIEVCRSAELYDKHCEMLANSAVGAEGMKLGEMLTQTSGRVYGLAGDLNASTMLPMFYPTIDRVHGTPITEAWGESFFGWAN